MNSMGIRRDPAILSRLIALERMTKMVVRAVTEAC
jgi:hypothetical protein